MARRAAGRGRGAAADVFSPEALARHLAGLRDRCDAAVVMGLDHPLVRAAIDDLVAHGIVVVTLVSDVPGSRRSRFVGIDNVTAGRTAASLLGRFVGPQRTGRHRDGQPGAARPRRTPVRLRAGHGGRVPAPAHCCRRSRATTCRSAPSRWSPSCCSAKPIWWGCTASAPATAASRPRCERSGRAERIVWICHELTPHARQALLTGVADAVINQDAGHEVRSACRLALAALSGERVLPDQERIRIDIFLRDNMP